MNLAGVGKILRRGLRLKCPACGETALYQSTFKMRERCAHCQLIYEREQGYFMGAIYLNVIVTEMLILGIYLGSLIFTDGASDRVYLLMFVLAIVLPLLFYRFSRSLWLSLDQIISPTRPAAKEKIEHPRLRDNGKVK